MGAKFNILSEKYLSDVLKELLSTTGSNFHPFGVEFAKLFLKRVFNDNKDRALQNSSVIREYPVYVKLKRGHTTKYLDLLFLDLDKNDNFVIGIENKFLTEDSENQLNDYYNSLKNIFKSNIKVVYLTLDGRSPKHLHNIGNNLVCLSWIDDILCMLLKLIYNTEDCEAVMKNWGQGRYPKYNDKELSDKLRDLITILVDIKKLEENSLKESNYFNNFIECLHKEYGKDKVKRYKFEIYNIENYIVFVYNDFKVWIPKNIHPDQAAHMLHQCFVNMWGVEKKDLNCDINEFKNCFIKNNIEHIKKSILYYLGKK